MTQLLSEPPLLRYYDLEKKVTIETDASDYGLGAVLLQAGRPVAFASRTMTETERRYSQIEKESLALMFGCTRFDHHLHGRENIAAVTDHKPLEKNHTCQKYQQRAQEVTTHDAATAKVPPKYCAQKGDSNVHNWSSVRICSPKRPNTLRSPRSRGMHETRERYIVMAIDSS